MLGKKCKKTQIILQNLENISLLVVSCPLTPKLDQISTHGSQASPAGSGSLGGV